MVGALNTILLRFQCGLVTRTLPERTLLLHCGALDAVHLGLVCSLVARIAHALHLGALDPVTLCFQCSCFAGLLHSCTLHCCTLHAVPLSLERRFFRSAALFSFAPAPGLLCVCSCQYAELLVLDVAEFLIVLIKRGAHLLLEPGDFAGCRAGSGKAHVLQRPEPGVVLLLHALLRFRTVCRVHGVVALRRLRQRFYLGSRQVLLVLFDCIVIPCRHILTSLDIIVHVVLELHALKTKVHALLVVLEFELEHLELLHLAVQRHDLRIV